MRLSRDLQPKIIKMRVPLKQNPAVLGGSINKLETEAEAARLLGLSPRTLRRWRQQHMALSYFRPWRWCRRREQWFFGRAVMYHRSEIAGYLAIRAARKIRRERSGARATRRLKPVVELVLARLARARARHEKLKAEAQVFADLEVR